MSCGKGTLTKTTTRAVLLVTVGLLGPPSTGISWRPTPGTLPGRVGQRRPQHSRRLVGEGKHMGFHPIYVMSFPRKRESSKKRRRVGDGGLLCAVGTLPDLVRCASVC